MAMSADLVALLYLLAGILFILALRGLSSPETSRRGNLFAMVGMAIAIATTLASHPPAGLGAWGLVVLGLAIGGSTGAVIARRAPIILPARHAINIALALAIVALIAFFARAESHTAFLLLALAAFAFGVLIIIPIGGADMPVVISMLNSYSGWAAAGIGFTLGNS